MPPAPPPPPQPPPADPEPAPPETIETIETIEAIEAMEPVETSVEGGKTTASFSIDEMMASAALTPAPLPEALAAISPIEPLVAPVPPVPPVLPSTPLPPVAPGAVEPALPTTAAVAPPANQPLASPPVGPNVPEGSLPTNATLSYDVKGQAKGFNYTAGGTLTWRQIGNTYEADLEISAFLLGSFQRTSTGLITAQGLVPQRFVDRRRSKVVSADFDRDAGVIRYSKKTPDAALLPGAQDQLSVMLQLAGLLNARKQLVVGDVISVPVSSDSDNEIWRFEIGAFETLQLPAGEVPARRLIRQPRKPNDKTVEVWLAPNLGRLPVRMRLTEPNGDFMDQLLEDIPEVAPQASPATGGTNSVP